MSHYDSCGTWRLTIEPRTICARKTNDDVNRFVEEQVDHIAGSDLATASGISVQQTVVGINMYILAMCCKYMFCILTNAPPHLNPIVKKFANIALWFARSPMGANIVLLPYYYDVSFDRKLHGNEQSICDYKLHSDSEQCATVDVLRELLNCRDDINGIEYSTYDEITLIIGEISAN